MGGSAVPALTESIVRHWSLAVTAGELNAGAGVAAKKDGEETQRRYAAFPRPRDNQGHATSEALAPKSTFRSVRQIVFPERLSSAATYCTSDPSNGRNNVLPEIETLDAGPRK